ncbi:MAG: hypothetical protein MJZ96_08980 [Paludibacteraceae bacterium]|nr:hypothetical protein [Paludibacteraceae bacterium]
MYNSFPIVLHASTPTLEFELSHSKHLKSDHYAPPTLCFRRKNRGCWRSGLFVSVL